MSNKREKVINVYDRDGNEHLCQIKRYFVLYVDVVGQNNQLENLQQKFHNPFETARGIPCGIIDDFQSAFTEVWAIRRSFLDSFRDCQKKYFNQQKQTFNVVPHFVFASDGLFIWIKLSDNDFLDDLATLKIVMDSVATSQMVLFSSKIFFKAAACISYGIEHPDFKDDYYGPGLARAANLESKAPYPCVLLDQDVIFLLQTYLKYAQVNGYQAMEEHCLILLEYKGPKKKIVWDKNSIDAYVFSPYKKFRRLQLSIYNNVMASLEEQTKRKDLSETIRMKYEDLLSDIFMQLNDVERN